MYWKEEIIVKFGEFLRQKRLNNNIKSKTMAELLDISPAYLSSLENGSRQPPSYELLEKITAILELNTDERFLLFDLAGENKNPQEIAKDLTEYIYQNPQIIEILRYAMKCRLSEKEWSIILIFVHRVYKY